MATADLVSGIGVSLILAAFALTTMKKLETNGRAYFILNACGGTLACVGAWLVGSVPFMILEAVWTAVAVAGLLKVKTA